MLSVNTRSAADAGTIHVASPVVTFQNGPGIILKPEDLRNEVNDPRPARPSRSTGARRAWRNETDPTKEPDRTILHPRRDLSETSHPSAHPNASSAGE